MIRWWRDENHLVFMLLVSQDDSTNKQNEPGKLALPGSVQGLVTRDTKDAEMMRLYVARSQ
jgi:hypothetical protein